MNLSKLFIFDRHDDKHRHEPDDIPSGLLDGKVDALQADREHRLGRVDGSEANHHQNEDDGQQRRVQTFKIRLNAVHVESCHPFYTYFILH